MRARPANPVKFRFCPAIWGHSKRTKPIITDPATPPAFLRLFYVRESTYFIVGPANRFPTAARANIIQRSRCAPQLRRFSLFRLFRRRAHARSFFILSGLGEDAHKIPAFQLSRFADGGAATQVYHPFKITAEHDEE
jgi:hypothetical protein